MLILGMCAQRTGAQERPLTVTASVSQPTVDGRYSVTVDLTAPTDTRVDVFMTMADENLLTYAMVEYRGATNGGGSCWRGPTIECYLSADTNGEERIDFTFQARERGPTRHELFVCIGQDCRRTTLEFVVTSVPMQFLPLAQQGGNS